MTENHTTLVLLVRDARAKGASIDEALAALREYGANVVDSLKAVRDAESISLGDAKKLIDASPVWEDFRLLNEQLRDAGEEALESAD